MSMQPVRAMTRYEEAAAVYRGSMRQAVCEVKEALVNLQSPAVRGIDAQTAVDGYRASFNGTEALYKNGLASLVELEDARRTLLTAQTTLASLQQTRNTAWVSLYRAMLVEYAIVARRGHDGSGGLPAVAPMGRFEALMDACHKRARPIFMTTLAMGAGMVPIAIGWGAADPSFRSPMAVAVIGGLITSTVRSLLLIPSVYSYLDDLEHGIKRMWGKLRRQPKSAEPGAEPLPLA